MNLFMRNRRFGITRALLMVSLLVIVVLLGVIMNSDSHNEYTRTFPANADQLLIPSDHAMNKMTDSELVLLFGRYTSSLQTLCRNVQRVGSIYDGGKEVCNDAAVRPGNNCLIYSFGSNNEFTFETHAIKLFNCEVHVFDPSMTQLNHEQIKNPNQSEFHSIGLGDKDMTMENNWKIRTLGTIMAQLNHSQRTIDLLKIDIENKEWSTLNEMMDSGSLNNVKQLLIELHFHYYDKTRRQEQLAVLRRLYNAGLRIFSKERNAYCKPKMCTAYVEAYGQRIAYLIEMSFINSRLV